MSPSEQSSFQPQTAPLGRRARQVGRAAPQSQKRSTRQLTSPQAAPSPSGRSQIPDRAGSAGGTIELDKSGRFYLRNAGGRMEMPLVAEGLRKLGMVARLVATGALLDKGYLFWDEPEANLNARLIKRVARSIVELSAGGIQTFIATHSLFLLREIEMQVRLRSEFDARFFGLHMTDAGASVLQGASVADIGSIAALDEELEQADRYIDAETGAALVSSSDHGGGSP